MSAIFGPGGNCEAFSRTHKSSLDAPAWICDFGLDCYEYECGQGIHIKPETAHQLGQAALAAGIPLSLHAPYFINLANPAQDLQEKNIRYITQSCLLADQMGASRVVIHSGALLKRTRQEALATAKESLRKVIAACDDMGLGHIALCPETMGKINQLGDLDEVLELCCLDERLIPCIDFGHLYARTLGELDGHEAYVKILDRMEEVLGKKRASGFHSHFSHICYRNSGESHHLTFANSDGFGPEWAPLAAEIVRRGWSPTFICESAGTQAEDALTMKQIYQEYQRAL